MATVGSGVYRYYNVYVEAKKLPRRGAFRPVDPLAIVFIKTPTEFKEIGRTSMLNNNVNPRFPETFQFAADSEADRAVSIRVDFYNRNTSEEDFLGYTTCPLSHLVSSLGRGVELAFQTPEHGDGDPRARAILTAIEGYRNVGPDAEKNVNFWLELEQSNYYGVQMRQYYELNVAANQKWVKVLQSDTTQMNTHGWIQYNVESKPLSQLTTDKNARMNVTLYRYKMIGSHKMIAYFEFSIAQLAKMQIGDTFPVVPSSDEVMLAATARLEFYKEYGNQYDISIKLINVQWRAEEAQQHAT